MSLRQPMGSPSPARLSTPSSATCQLRQQPGLPFSLLGRADLALCQLQHVEPQRQSSDRSSACYLTLQREVLPQSGSHNQDCQMRTVRRAPRPQQVSTGTYRELRGGGGLEAQAQWRVGHTVQINQGWN